MLIKKILTHIYNLECVKYLKHVHQNIGKTRKCAIFYVALVEQHFST
jgi:hypothetical protein